MKIFLTGHNGFIGRHLWQRYADEHKVLNYNRYQSISDRLHIAEPDVIINCAAELNDPEQMYRSNVDLVHHILDYCRKFPRTRFIQIGSSSEYGQQESATTENTGLMPQDMYGATKAAASLLCQAWARAWNLNIVVLRAYSPYGAGDREHRLFSRLWRAFAYDQPMQLTQGVHDWIYISDFVDAVDKVLHSTWPPGEVLNVGSGQQTSNRSIFETWKSITGHDAPVELVEEMSTPTIWCADNSRIRQRHGWSPQVDIRNGIEKLIQQQIQLDNCRPNWAK
jgi:nucleoside-diphosphate-sugar epimerase